MKSITSPMLRLFLRGTKAYQPDLDLKAESGDPEVSVENICRLLGRGLRIRDLLVRPTGVLVLFATGEQYYAPALRVGTTGLATEALAHIASEAGLGSFEEMLGFLQHLPESYCAEIPHSPPLEMRQ